MFPTDTMERLPRMRQKQPKALHCSSNLHSTEHSLITDISVQAACQLRMNLMNPVLATLGIQWGQGLVLTLRSISGSIL